MTTSCGDLPRIDATQLAAPESLTVVPASQLEDFRQLDDCPPQTLNLLTVQTPEACRRLAAGERLSGSARHVEQGDVAAYAWMNVQLERLGWEVTDTPVWAWARVDFDELVGRWPEGAVEGIVVLVVQVPVARVVLSAFDPWQELLDEQTEGMPGSAWARCLEIDKFPESALQATLPFLELDDVVRACRLHED